MKKIKLKITIEQEINPDQAKLLMSDIGTIEKLNEELVHNIRYDFSNYVSSWEDKFKPSSIKVDSEIL